MRSLQSSLLALKKIFRKIISPDMVFLNQSTIRDFFFYFYLFNILHKLYFSYIFRILYRIVISYRNIMCIFSTYIFNRALIAPKIILIRIIIAQISIAAKFFRFWMALWITRTERLISVVKSHIAARGITDWMEFREDIVWTTVNGVTLLRNAKV